jgi:mono/diheme cytochrome c family protein
MSSASADSAVAPMTTDTAPTAAPSPKADTARADTTSSSATAKTAGPSGSAATTPARTTKPAAKRSGTALSSGGAGAPTTAAQDTAKSTAAQTTAAKPATQPSGGAPTPQQVALGDSIFHGQAAGGTCTACHGQDAKGTAVAPNLTDSEWLNGDGSYQFIVTTVTNGVPQPKQHPAPMPPKGGASLSDDQVKAVAAYVYSLSHKT